MTTLESKGTSSKYKIRDPEKIKYLLPSELSSLLESVKLNSIRDHAIFLTAITHGLRAAEVGILQLADIDQDAKRIYIRRVKNGINAQYKLSEECWKGIRLWLMIRKTSPGPLFVSRKTNLNRNKLPMPMPEDMIAPEGIPVAKKYDLALGVSPRQLNTLFVHYGTLANLPKDKLHFHTLRHTCGVNMVDKEIPMLQIKDWLGHRNINSTMIYANVSDSTRDRTAEMMFGQEERVRKEKKKDKIEWKKDKRNG